MILLKDILLLKNIFTSKIELNFNTVVNKFVKVLFSIKNNKNHFVCK